MLTGGTPTLYVTNLDRSIAFFTQTLGLELKGRPSEGWAEIDAGGGLILGLHPFSPHAASPGTRGAITVGFDVTETLEMAMGELERRGVRFRTPILDNPGSPVRLVFFSDPDGNELYLRETRPKRR